MEQGRKDYNEVVLKDGKRVIEIEGRQFTIGKLSLAQTGKFTNWGIKVSKKISELFSQEDKSNNTDEFMKIMEVLNEDEMADLVSILLSASDNIATPEFCKSIPIEDITEIIAEVAENNNIGKILKNVQRVIKAISKAVQESKK